MKTKNEAFEKTYNEYLAKLDKLNLPEIANRLKLDESGRELLVSLLGDEFRVSKAGIIDPNRQRAEYKKCIVIFKYLLMCPLNVPTETDWVAYHSFKNAQPLLHYFAREVTDPIEHCFTGQLGKLRYICEEIGETATTDSASYDLSVQFDVLSQVPLFLRFNDADDDFPAQCTILFRETVERYLDMESVAILGALFAKKLTALGGD